MLGFLAGFVVAAVLLGLLVVVNSRRRQEFFSYAIDTLDAIRQGRYDVRLYDSGGKSHQALMDSINQMAQAVEENIVLLSHERDVLQHILRSMTTGVIYVGSNSRVQMVNEAAERMFRRPAEQWLNQEHWALFRDYNVSAAIDRALLFGTPWHNELKLRDNMTVEVQLIVLEVSLRGETAKTVHDVLLICNDVSEWRRLERMRSEFVANVSHELKTPVAAIQGFAETLLDGDVDEESQTAFLNTIYNEAVRMGNLISDLLELSKLEGAEHTVQPKAMRLNRVIERAQTNLQGSVEKHNLVLKVHPCEDVTVWADEEKVLQVLLNLITNAIHYTPMGGTIEIRCDTLVDRVKVHVADTGIGIPENDQQRVFERFYRVDRDRSRATGGTGLGLAIVKHIVNVHGGQVGVDSLVGQGSDFWFTLPRIGATMQS
ncbi:PAS domain-containing protein [Alicyclobacillus tolerans]|uniref:two-component system histidine kinase PnpS n=1 Tax=Alicyclobacillus tolerans TaxID=90970 RepID=UPI001F3D721C|nr:ATP-binding protein [Alicyclobacillus tolerans]MCF8567744.1 PAS domain-containing protein [Alicyclobacillus tolerans]